MVARPFAEQTAQHVDVLGEVAVADGLVLPDALRQPFLSDEAAVGRKERTQQNREALGDRRDLLAAEEQAPRRIEPAVAEKSTRRMRPAAEAPRSSERRSLLLHLLIFS